MLLTPIAIRGLDKEDFDIIDLCDGIDLLKLPETSVEFLNVCIESVMKEFDKVNARTPLTPTE